MSVEGPGDNDPVETQEWLEAAANVLSHQGTSRLEYLLSRVVQRTSLQLNTQQPLNSAYCNTIPYGSEAQIPGDQELEHRIRALIRWNAMAIVVRAQKIDGDLGGHIGTFASSATLYDVGFNHFWRAPSENFGGDLIYIQGHASPGIYARSYLTGQLSEEQLVHFRREIGGKGLSSYPHPWLMPNYWQFPTVSMGLGPLQAIYQARFMRYLEARDLSKPSARKVWCFCGDGEMDEVESIGALSLGAREHLDNLIFVVNCNLQRLDGPVRGNGKVIQELESTFRGAGWNVIKVVWGGNWDPLFDLDTDGLMLRRMEEAIDGDYQNYKARGGAYTREHFFGKYPELKARVAQYSDQDIWRLNRGGHDAQKVYAAYHAAMNHRGRPTVILAKTVKGYGLGVSSEAKNIAHNTKKLGLEELKTFRDRFNIPIRDEALAEVPFYKPEETSPEIQYLKERRAQLGGHLPQRRRHSSQPLKAIPELATFSALLDSSGDRKLSTTMAFVRILSALCKDSVLGARIVPIVPDEARTFGMEGLFRQIGIYSSVGQNYEPVDADQVMSYREAKNGQILEEGINEAGAFCSWISAATSYSTHDVSMVPFYIYYSMFGFQRVGDLAWAAGDLRSRGFLIGGTSGRTTLNGEGLQHQDGHSHLLASTIPNCISYDPSFAYELAVIIQHGLKRMILDGEDVYFYITTMNENYAHPKMPAHSEEGIIQGLYRFSQAESSLKHRVQLLGSGSILNEVIAAASMLAEDFQVGADVWSVTSFTELRKQALEVQRHNHLNPGKTPQLSYVEQCLGPTIGPVIAASDYMKLQADQLRAFVPGRYCVLGTDGFGRSDTREALRHFFEVDRYYIAYSAIKALVDEGELAPQLAIKAMKKYNIDPKKADPTKV